MPFFIVKAAAFQSGGGVPPWIAAGVGTSAELLAFFNDLTEVNYALTLESENLVFLPDSDGIYLDGSPTPISENDLPPGFTITQGTTFITGQFIVNGTGSFQARVGAAVSPPLDSVLAYPSVPPLTMNGILATTYGFDIVAVDIDNNVQLRIVFIIGQYEIVTYVFTVNPGPYDPGEIVNITSDGVNPDLLEMTAIQLTYNDSLGEEHVFIILPVDFLLWTSINLSFILPDDIFKDVVGDVVITGTLFGGSVAIATISILFVNGSGIYRIVLNKTNDTAYVDSSDDGETVDVKIPNPFIKTGFIGG